ncbi:MAG TPA: AtpZ/AtpI family protein [Candidatus Kapabacteria bacterium]|jgi:F0F1-type ATP synthase assembly protein I|nr:AtpZ/AtpI family protein [Candidatus Kapabacteria bacterium]HOM04735.1 AtpZ/AtpI family protein [Candidatus Kapabacteria bacterium]HOQ48367.1 AtpZ/AtpI family protein [Candidatus Kapabacteria bacterium]HPP40410.1 AtpZ/AtpI family protein [Candidatus Kapabacteria bacterium]HPU23796.1 AtpZ/AtpI family protein [Candidatus Kapabacteria bacterium]
MASKNKTKVREALFSSIREMAPFMNLGMQMAIPVVLFTLLGWWIDSKNNTSPLFILLFAAIGVFAAFYYFFKAIKKK